MSKRGRTDDVRKRQAERAAEGANLRESFPEAWRGELGRGGTDGSPRAKVTLPRVGFLERPDLSKL